MKRAGKIISLVALIVVFSTSLAFAGTVNLKDSYPKDGATGTSIENLGVKLYFDAEMTAGKAGKANEKSDVFKLCDADGKALPTRVLYPEKEEGVVLVLLDTNRDANKDGKADVKAQSNSSYTLTISKNLVDDKGNHLAKDEEITFKTLNQSSNMIISMLMTFGMFGGMIFFSMRGAKKAAQESASKKEDKVNPYKEAKRTGKSVEEIVEQDQKAKAKKAAKEAAKAAKDDDEAFEWIDINTYRVKRRQPVSTEQSAFVAKRKADLQAKREAEEARQARYKKNAKKGKKKK